jgi:predicted transcriptional regulator
MKELGAAGLIGADEAKRQFVLTEKGFEALQ